MENPGPLTYLAIALLLVLLALLSAFEAAITAVGRNYLRRFADKGSAKAKYAMKLLSHYDKALFTILIGGNLIKVSASILAAMLFIPMIGMPGAIMAIMGIVALILIFGEILPKAYGRDRSERIILNLSGLLCFFMALLSPVTWLFMKLRNFVSPPEKEGPSVTEEELHYLLESVEEEGVIEEQERDLVQSALAFDDIDIKDILTPRVNMISLDIGDSPEEVKRVLLDEGYSRIPVCEDGVDNVVGFLMAKEYLRQLVEGRNPDLRQTLSKPLFVHRSMKLSGLLAFFRAKRANMAIVTDDYGGTLGLVTTEDIVEELVGDLWDEDEDVEPAAFVRVDENTCEVRGSFSLRELLEEQEWLGIDDEGDYNTVNGWAVQIFGRIPAIGETISIGSLTLTVLQMDNNVIDILKIHQRDAGPNALRGL